MRPSIASPARAFVPMVIACALAPHHGAAQEVRARVVDDAQRSALADATALLLAADSSVITGTTSGPDGFFTLEAPGPGEYLVRVEHPGYETITREVALDQTLAVIPAFVLRVAAIPLDTLEARATPTEIAGREVGRIPGRVTHVLAGERLATLERNGVSFASAVRDLGASVRVRSVMVGERSYTCIESSRGPASISDAGRVDTCRLVAIIIDGVDTGVSHLDPDDALRFVRTLQLHEYESMEYLSPVEAGSRYGLGASERGALVLWTRGHGPHRSDARGGGGTAVNNTPC